MTDSNHPNHFQVDASIRRQDIQNRMTHCLLSVEDNVGEDARAPEKHVEAG